MVAVQKDLMLVKFLPITLKKKKKEKRMLKKSC